MLEVWRRLKCPDAAGDVLIEVLGEGAGAADLAGSSGRLVVQDQDLFLLRMIVDTVESVLSP